MSWRHFRVHKDDFQDITGKLDGELMKADFWDVTGKSDIKPMLSCNQLKVGRSFAETTTEAKSVQKFCLEREEEVLFLRGQG